MFIIELALWDCSLSGYLWFRSPHQAKLAGSKSALDRTKLLADRALVLAEQSSIRGVLKHQPGWACRYLFLRTGRLLWLRAMDAKSD